MKTFRFTIFDIAVIAIGSALLFGSQVAMQSLPNIELVSLLIILFTIHFRYRTLVMIYLFAVLEGLVYGFGMWWFAYLYVWTVLYALVLLFREVKTPIIWAVLSGIYGLLFGTLCSIPTFLLFGFSSGIAFIISGFPFDLMHCIGNFLLALLLFGPLDRVLKKIKQNPYL